MHVRVARHTDRLEDVVAFWRDGLGLPEIGRFRDHDDYDGVFLEIPGTHLELLASRAEPVTPANPYRAEHGLTFEDPDGFRVVLVPERWGPVSSGRARP